MLKHLAAGALALLISSSACAQDNGTGYRLVSNGKTITAATPLPVTISTSRESFQLVANNTASNAVTLYGGDYILSQACTGYGTLTFERRNPDGITYKPMFTKTALDTGNDSGIVLGSFAVVRVTISGTTGCNAILARVPS